MPSRLNPREAQRRATLKDKATVSTYGKLVIQLDAHRVPIEVLAGAVHTAVKAYDDMDKETIEKFREIGEAFMDADDKKDSPAKSKNGAS